jgi:hypothetical protein
MVKNLECELYILLLLSTVKLFRILEEFSDQNFLSDFCIGEICPKMKSLDKNRTQTR